MCLQACLVASQVLCHDILTLIGSRSFILSLVLVRSEYWCWRLNCSGVSDFLESKKAPPSHRNACSLLIRLRLFSAWGPPEGPAFLSRPSLHRFFHRYLTVSNNSSCYLEGSNHRAGSTASDYGPNLPGVFCVDWVGLVFLRHLSPGFGSSCLITKISLCLPLLYLVSLEPGPFLSATFCHRHLYYLPGTCQLLQLYVLPYLASPVLLHLKQLSIWKPGGFQLIGAHSRIYALECQRWHCCWRCWFLVFLIFSSSVCTIEMDVSFLLKKWEQHFMCSVARVVSEAAVRLEISRASGNSGLNH